jgi:23S rRNA A2030 N6-methylase RlmJ
MANRHFGKFADVWKHLILDEVVAGVRPEGYAETHAGSAAYPLPEEPERRYGVLGFLDGLAASPTLSDSKFARVVSGFAGGEPRLYPGSALQVMTLLGDASAYLLCDLDPASTADLRAWASRLGLRHCQVVQQDGMAAVRDWLPSTRNVVVHIDPFDPFAHQDDSPSAVELAAEVAEAGHSLVYWYGYDRPAERAWAFGEIGSRSSAPLWCGDALVSSYDHQPDDDGDLGQATTPGTGCGIVLANVPRDVTAAGEDVARALVEHYAGKALPNGERGRLDLKIHRGGPGSSDSGSGATS